MEEDESLTGAMEALESSLEQGDLEQARKDLGPLREGLAGARLSPSATRFTRRGLEELDDAL